MSKWWLLYMAFGVAIFIAVTYAIFSYWDIGDGNKWSTFFSFISAFGIFATIGVYLLQRKDNEKTEKELTTKKNKSISDVLILECMRIRDDLKYTKKIHKHIIKIKSNDVIIDRNGDYAHITILRSNKFPLKFNIRKIKYEPLSNLLVLSINTDGYYSETICSVVYRIAFINEKIEEWTADKNYLFTERIDLIQDIIELEERIVEITSSN